MVAVSGSSCGRKVLCYKRPMQFYGQALVRRFTHFLLTT